jgi:hypothetical protein
MHTQQGKKPMTLEATGRISNKLANLEVSSEGWKVCRVALESLVMAHFF